MLKLSPKIKIVFVADNRPIPDSVGDKADTATKRKTQKILLFLRFN